MLQHLVNKLWGLSTATPRAPVRWLASPHTSLRGELLARWVKFFQSLRSSSSPGVATLARVSARELRTTSDGNNYLITNLSLTASTATSGEVWEKILKNKPKEITEHIVMLGLLLQELYTDFDDSPGDKDDRSMDRRVFRRLFGQMCHNNASSRSVATAIVPLVVCNFHCLV